MGRTVLVWPGMSMLITSVSWCAWPDARSAPLGQMTLPDLSLNDEFPTWVSGTKIEPSEWTMRADVVVVGEPSRNSWTFMVALVPPAAGAREIT